MAVSVPSAGPNLWVQLGAIVAANVVVVQVKSVGVGLCIELNLQFKKQNL
jgi:hypothetical protein